MIAWILHYNKTLLNFDNFIAADTPLILWNPDYKERCSGLQ